MQLGRKSKQHQAYASIDTEEDRSQKESEGALTAAEREPRKQKPRSNTPKPIRRLNEAFEKTEGTSWTTSQDRPNAGGKGDVKELYSLTRTLEKSLKDLSDPRTEKSVSVKRGSKKWWEEHFKELLIRPPPSEMSDI